MRYRAFVSGSTVAVVLAVWRSCQSLDGSDASGCAKDDRKEWNTSAYAVGQTGFAGDMGLPHRHPSGTTSGTRREGGVDGSGSCGVREGGPDAPTATVTSPLEMSEITTSSGTTEARRSPELGVRH